MIDQVTAQAGVETHRSPVGEANVAAAMKRVGAVVGGEGNGGVIWPPIGYVRDSIATMALVLEMMAMRGKTIAELADELPTYTIVKEKLEIAPGMAERAIEGLAERFSDARKDRQDGIRIDTQAGWLHVRPSNTEPILRIIAEADDEAAARELIDSARRCVEP
jgi:phosphomannomutase